MIDVDVAWITRRRRRRRRSRRRDGARKTKTPHGNVGSKWGHALEPDQPTGQLGPPRVGGMPLAPGEMAPKNTSPHHQSMEWFKGKSTGNYMVFTIKYIGVSRFPSVFPSSKSPKMWIEWDTHGIISGDHSATLWSCDRRPSTTRVRFEPQEYTPMSMGIPGS